MCAFSDTTINGLFTLFGVIVGGIVAYFNSLFISKKAAKRLAASNLRAAFAPYTARARVEINPTANNIQSILSTGIDNITIEMEKFRFYICADGLPAYEKACNEYINMSRNQAMDYFIGFDGREPLEVLEDRVNAIFHFTKP